ncbi:hypothetical protein [Paenibacillus alvei]|uniref:Uncharacterized protein n=1 Tax=Paenibacillus alvei TaxID=44250 RepID=A0A383RBW5_PAEAL|nr:hypothetical protein [Paenibacillus alvei]SYX84615.1 conserved protein of unknown function [Paenibacillus alvei]
MKCPNCGGDYSDSIMHLHLDRCEIIEEDAHEVAAPDDDTPIEEMGLPALRDYAAKNNIELNGAIKKADVLAAILEERNDSE